MEIVPNFIIYLVLFRIAIIAAGVISIILGYRLFCKGIWPDAGSGKGADVDAQIGGTRFTLKNAAPGTCFALFGVFIIVIMFAKGGAELTLKNLRDGALSGVSIDELKLRGDEKAGGLQAEILKGREFERQGDDANAIAAYEEALELITEPINNLAWLYQKQERYEEGLPLSRMAVWISPNKANYLDTLATILFKTGKHSEALSLMENAARLNPEYRDKLERFREVID